MTTSRNAQLASMEAKAFTYLDALKLSTDELLDDINTKIAEGYYKSGGVDATPDIVALVRALLQATVK